jgi:hypothetical protein
MSAPENVATLPEAKEVLVYPSYWIAETEEGWFASYGTAEEGGQIEAWGPYESEQEVTDALYAMLEEQGDEEAMPAGEAV